MRETQTGSSAVGLGRHPDWRQALDEALAQLAAARGASATADLALLFASAAYAEDFRALAAEAQLATGARVLIGCSGQGIIGGMKEVEGEPALALMTLALPDAALSAAHLTQAELERCDTPEALRRALGAVADDTGAWLIFADPFTLDAERLLEALAAAYPGSPLLGGLASGDPSQRRTHLFLRGDVYEEGAVLLALGGPWAVRAVVSQGCAPIGQPWTITGAQGQAIETIGGKPALEVLIETLRALPAEVQERAQRNLLLGLAMDEYREEFGRGDFLIRNLMGADRESGALVIGALPRVGQTVQFQLRDAAAADEDLRILLERERALLGEDRPVAALLCSCNGRGVGLFGAPDHDAAGVAEVLGPLPLAGFFCNGEIGPVGGKAYLHGFTASIALLVRNTGG